MDNKTRLYQIVSEVFDVSPSQLNPSSAKGELQGWDSLGTVNLINALEEGFSVQFDLLEIADLETISQVQDALLKKGVTF